MSDGIGREFTYLSSHATNRYFIPNWGSRLFRIFLSANAQYAGIALSWKWLIDDNLNFLFVVIHTFITIVCSSYNLARNLEGFQLQVAVRQDNSLEERIFFCRKFCTLAECTYQLRFFGAGA